MWASTFYLEVHTIGTLPFIKVIFNCIESGCCIKGRLNMRGLNHINFFKWKTHNYIGYYWNKSGKENYNIYMEIMINMTQHRIINSEWLNVESELEIGKN
jgi:hypothetical protein